MRFHRCLFAGLALLLGCGSPDRRSADFAPYGPDVAAALELAGENSTELVSVLESVPPEMRGGAAFIISTMAYPDLAAVKAEVLREHLDYAYRVRSRYAWTRNVPEEVFLHYVLPYRCAEEPIEAYRKYFYEQLDPIVSPLTRMADVVHQVNLWLGAPKPDGKPPRVRFVPHEARDQGPLETLKSGYGRCEEEMIVCMSALRSVGIPCRSAWTPYWAICDNNHAWVEVWVDGHWIPIGGCEPGTPWFEHPAKRAGAIFCAAFGQPKSELIHKTLGNTTIINSTPNYSRTCTVNVEVRSNEDKPLPGMAVVFSVYNWGSFRAFSGKTTDAGGKAQFVTGIGEYFLSTGKDNLRAWRLVKTEPDRTLDIVLRLAPDAAPEGYLFLRYPSLEEAKASFNIPDLAPTHATLLAPSRPAPPETYAFEEFDPAPHADLMALLSGSPAKDAVVQKLKSAGGNWPRIAEAIRNVAPERKADLLQLISQLAHLETLEVTAEILLDHVDGAAEARQAAKWRVADDLYRPYVLSPQFQYLHMSPWRQELRRRLSGIPVKTDSPTDAARSINEWVQSNLKIRKDLASRFSYVASPLDTFRSRVGDSYAVAVFTAGLLRALGVPAKVKNDWVEFHDGANWLPLYPHDLQNFANARRDEKTRLEYSTPPAGLKVNYLVKGLTDPNPWEKFAISRFTSGTWEHLEPDDLKRFGKWLVVQPGTYLVTAGVRNSNGDAMVYSKQMELQSGQGIVMDLPMDIPLDKLPAAERMVRRLDPIPMFELPDLDGKAHSLQETLKAGPVLVTFFSLDTEPSIRMLPIIDQMKARAKEAGAEILAVYVDPEGAEKLRADGRLGSLKIPVLLDSRQDVVRKFIPDLEKSKARCLPSTLLIGKGGKVVMWDEGYNMAIATALESAFGLLENKPAAAQREPKITRQPFEVGPDHAGEADRLYKEGNYAKAIESYRKALELNPDDPSVWYNLACTYALVKRVDEAFDALKKSVEFGWTDFNWMDNDPDLTILRGDPRYKELRK